MATTTVTSSPSISISSILSILTIALNALTTIPAIGADAKLAAVFIGIIQAAMNAYHAAAGAARLNQDSARNTGGLMGIFGLDQDTITQLKAMPAKVDAILTALQDIQNRLTDLQGTANNTDADVEKLKPEIVKWDEHP